MTFSLRSTSHKDEAGLTTAIFDVDGVLTDTASIHFRAWSALFDDVLRGSRPFTRWDYDRLVDGRSRLDGLRAVLADRQLPEQAHIEQMAQHKQELFGELVHSEGVDTFTDVVPALNQFLAAGMSLAAASASRNAMAVLDAAELTDYFLVVVDGNVAGKLGLAGKPAPDLFLTAAQSLNAVPGDCLLAEDSIAGLQAGRDGGFGLVVGVDRSPAQDRNLDEFADIVVGSLTALSPELLTRAHRL